MAVDVLESYENNTEKEATAEEAQIVSTNLKDEFCSDAAYCETDDKNLSSSTPPSTRLASAPPPSPSRGLGGIDYYTRTYDDDDYDD